MSEENKNIENNEENSGNIENAESIENIENVENAENAENAENIENTENTETADMAAETELSAAQNSEAELSEEKTAGMNKKGIIAAVIAVIVVIVLAGAAIMYSTGVFETNKYNKMGYINISGRTLEDVAKEAGMSVDEFKTEYRLPEDMTGDTDESAAFYNIPTGKIAEMYGMQFSEVIELLQLPDTITEETPWGEAEGEAALKNYVGEDMVESFKEEYALGDDVTGDTKWKEIRNIVDKVALEDRKEAEKEAAKATEAADDASAEGQELTEEELQALLGQAVASQDGTASTTPAPDAAVSSAAPAAAAN